MQPFENEKKKIIKEFSIHSPQLAKEHCFLEGSQALSLFLADKSSVWIKVSMEHWWNDNYRRRPKYAEKNHSHCCFVHEKSHVDWPGIEHILLG